MFFSLYVLIIFSDLASLFIDNLDCLAGIFHKELFSGAVIESHGHINLTGPIIIILAEPTIFITVGVGFLVLLPEEKKGYTLQFEFLVNILPVR